MIGSNPGPIKDEPQRKGRPQKNVKEVLNIDPELRELKTNLYKRFNVAFALMSIIPFLAFFYLIGKLLMYDILVGYGGLVVLISICVSLCGFWFGYDILKNILDRVMSLHNGLTESYKKLKELQKLKDDLSGMISHDINNFLIGIRGNLELLSADDKKLPDDVRGNLSVAMGSSDDLSALVSDFIDVTKMEENRLKPRLEKVGINSLIKDAVEKIRPVAKKVGVELTNSGAGDEIYFNVDRVLILRTVINLLINAVKFTPAGGRVEAACAANGTQLKVSVRDTGPGIPVEFKDKIFEKFAQIETRKANLKKGKGLGLTFCKLAVEAHNGKIWVEDPPDNKGSIFCFTIPGE